MLTTIDAVGASRSIPWVEKYRPRSFRDIVSHHDIIQTISRILHSGQLPHLLLHGPPGTGKTSTAGVIARTLYGPAVNTMVLELNASDDRGINIVRDTIKTFAETQPSVSSRPVIAQEHPNDGGAHGSLSVHEATRTQNTDSSGPGLVQGDVANSLSAVKLIILDETDQMTGPAQMALRRIIEKYTRYVRFLMICNSIHKINPALQSRCTKFRFALLRHEDIKRKILQVSDAENITITDNGVETLIKVAQGDMRKVINTLQSVAMSNMGKVIEEGLILEILGLPTPRHMEALVFKLSTGTFKEAFDHLVEILRDNGYSLSDVVSALYLHLLKFDLPTSTACITFPAIAQVEYRLATGADETIQAASVVTTLIAVREDLARIGRQSLLLDTSPAETVL